MSLDANIRRSLVLPAVCAPMTMVSGPALVSAACKNGIMAGLPPLRQAGLDPDALPVPIAARKYEHLPAGARPWRTLWSAGQGIDLIGDVPSVTELVRRLRQEYVAACRVADMSDEARCDGPMPLASPGPGAAAAIVEQA